MATIYTKEILEEAVRQSDSLQETIRFLGKRPSGGLNSYLSKLISKYEIDTTHFTYSKNRTRQAYLTRKKPEEILVLITDSLAPRAKASLLTRALVETGVPYKCSNDFCGISEWGGQPITLDVDHIDGNPLDCRKENLRFLCPNCHRQTPTFGRRKTSKSLSRSLCKCGRNKDSRAKICGFCYATNASGNNGRSQLKTLRICPSCNSNPVKTRQAKTCQTCYQASKKGTKRPNTESINWPDAESLIVQLKGSNYSKVARTLGVSDNGIRRRLASLGYDPKTLTKTTS